MYKYDLEWHKHTKETVGMFNIMIFYTGDYYEI